MLEYVHNSKLTKSMIFIILKQSNIMPFRIAFAVRLIVTKVFTDALRSSKANFIKSHKRVRLVPNTRTKHPEPV